MPEFDVVSDRFIAYYETVRGYIREQLVQNNLQELLPPAPAQVIDIGGGDGRDTEWLARQGFKVQLVEPSKKMLAAAKKRLDPKLKVKLSRLNSKDIAKTLKPAKFDLVLSHGVLMYCLDEPETHLKTVASLLRKGGIVSIVTKGYWGALSRAVQAYDIGNMQRILWTQQATNNLELAVWAFKLETVRQMLENNGLRLIDWRGIRLVSDNDHRPIKTLAAAELKQLLELEKLLSRNQYTKGMGQMIQYFARKL